MRIDRHADSIEKAECGSSLVRKNSVAQKQGEEEKKKKQGEEMLEDHAEACREFGFPSECT